MLPEMPSTAAAGRRYLPVAAAIAAAAIVAMASFPGCQDTNRSPRSQQVGTAQTREQMNTQNLLYAFSVLRGIDEGQTQKSLHTVVDRLNQWSQHKEPLPDWTPDPLLAELPKELHDLNSVRHLDELKFVQTDGRDLQQTVWLSAIADRARGEDSAALATAQSLFDWVVRNIQLERDGAIEVPHLPGETLLFGRGTAADRAWIFALLARQQRLDVVMLALPSKEASAEPRLWLPALFLDGELYLFDTRLGLPILGPDGKPVATLNDVLADEKLLRNLDVDEQRRYPVAAGDLERVAVLVEGSPMYLSERMRLVEAELPGKESLVITTRPAALAERIKSHPHVESVRLWELPYERIRSIANPDAQDRAGAEAFYRAHSGPVASPRAAPARSI